MNIHTYCAMIIAAMLLLPGIAESQPSKCKAGTKRCGPICIPAGEPCSIRTIKPRGMKKPKRKWKRKSAVPKAPLLPSTEALSSQLEACEQHADISTFTIATAGSNLNGDGWSSSSPRNKTADNVKINVVNITKGSERGAVGVFVFGSVGHASLFTQQMNAERGAGAVRHGGWVLAISLDVGDHGAAMDALRIAAGCSLKAEE